MNAEEFERLEEKSVNHSEAQRIERIQDYQKRKGNRKGRIGRGIAAFLIIVSLILGGKLGVDYAKPYFDGSYVNQTYSVAYESIGPNTHRTSDNRNYWYDVDSVAGLYDSNTMDFDSFVYGAYNGMHMRPVENMDDLFWQFKMRGITDYNSFVEYVKGKGFTKKTEGQVIADVDAWKSAMKKQIRVGNELNDAYSRIGNYTPGNMDLFLLSNGIPDIDIYIYRIYNEVGWNDESRLMCMDELMEDLYNQGFTTYASFLNYCESRGFVKENKEGKTVVDVGAYEKELRTITEKLDLVHKYMDEIEEFSARDTLNKEKEGLGK